MLALMFVSVIKVVVNMGPIYKRSFKIYLKIVFSNQFGIKL